RVPALCLFLPSPSDSSRVPWHKRQGLSCLRRTTARRGKCREVAASVIEFINVSKVYANGVTALRDVSLHIDRGEFVFLVGPSGAGKSTLVRLIYREEVPTRGIVLVDGLNLGRLRRRDVPFLRRQMGVVFQDFKLLPNRTAYENVA